MSNLSYYEMRVEMSRVAKFMWEKRLTNAAGGNFAVRVDNNRILLSPSKMSEEKHCDLSPSDFLLIDYDQNILEGEGSLSRETLMHVLILSHFQEIGCTIHAHPFHCMPFVSKGIDIPSMTEATLGRGPVVALPWRKAYSEELSRGVYEYYETNRELAVRKPIGCILTRHGVVVSGPNIYMAYSMLERIESDAYCAITSSLI